MKYILGFLATILLIIVLIVLLVGGGGKTTPPKTNKTLLDYDNSSAVVRLTVDGPVNADAIHTQEKISVDKDQVVYQKMTGYNGGVVDQRVYGNTQAAYASFLQSLEHAGFTRGDNDPAKSDERGYCSTGNRYIFELIDGSKTVERYWTTSCDKPKTYLGNTGLTLELFKNQVADYAKQNTDFNFGLSF